MSKNDGFMVDELIGDGNCAGCDAEFSTGVGLAVGLAVGSIIAIWAPFPK